MTLLSCCHCGLCCIEIPCQLAQVFFKIGENTQCPALEETDGLFYCGLIRNTTKYVSELVGGEDRKVKVVK